MMNSAGHLHLKKSEIAKNINPVFLAVFFSKIWQKNRKNTTKAGNALELLRFFDNYFVTIRGHRL